MAGGIPKEAEATAAALLTQSHIDLVKHKVDFRNEGQVTRYIMKTFKQYYLTLSHKSLDDWDRSPGD